MKSVRKIDIPSTKKKLDYLGFFAIYPVIFLVVLGVWASSNQSGSVFVLCLWILALSPLVFSRYSIFEPITIYLALFLIPFTIKPLLNQYISSTGDGFLFFLSGNENLYEIGFPFATLFVLIHIYLVHTIYFLSTRRKSSLLLQISKSRWKSGQAHFEDFSIWKKTTFLGFLIYIPALIYFIIFIQGMNFEVYAANRNNLLLGQGFAWLLANLGTPLAICYFYIFILKIVSKKSGILYISLAIFCVITTQFVAPGRGNIINIIIASIIIYWWKVSSVSFSKLSGLAIAFVLFSLTSLHIREGVSQFNYDSVIFFISQDIGMFDYFTIYVGKMFSSDLGLSYGAQLLRNFYVFLPRAFFPQKPLFYSTLEIQDANQIVPVESSHVSITPFVEWLFNFGILGIVFGSVVLAVSLVFIYRGLTARGRDIGMISYALIFPTFVVGYLKGGFSLAFQFFWLSPAWLIVLIYLCIKHIFFMKSLKKNI